MVLVLAKMKILKNKQPIKTELFPDGDFNITIGNSKTKKVQLFVKLFLISGKCFVEPAQNSVLG